MDAGARKTAGQRAPEGNLDFPRARFSLIGCTHQSKCSKVARALYSFLKGGSNDPRLLIFTYMCVFVLGVRLLFISLQKGEKNLLCHAAFAIGEDLIIKFSFSGIFHQFLNFKISRTVV